VYICSGPITESLARALRFLVTLLFQTNECVCNELVSTGVEQASANKLWNQYFQTIVLWVCFETTVTMSEITVWSSRVLWNLLLYSVRCPSDKVEQWITRSVADMPWNFPTRYYCSVAYTGRSLSTGTSLCSSQQALTHYLPLYCSVSI
jgi:hypothetical protein